MDTWLSFNRIPQIPIVVDTKTNEPISIFAINVLYAQDELAYGKLRLRQEAPLSVAFVEKDSGLNVIISFATSGGVSSKASDVAAQFCAIVRGCY